MESIDKDLYLPARRSMRVKAQQLNAPRNTEPSISEAANPNSQSQKATRRKTSDLKHQKDVEHDADSAPKRRKLLGKPASTTCTTRKSAGAKVQNVATSAKPGIQPSKPCRINRSPSNSPSNRQMELRSKRKSEATLIAQSTRQVTTEPGLERGSTSESVQRTTDSFIVRLQLPKTVKESRLAGDPPYTGDIEESNIVVANNTYPALAQSRRADLDDSIQDVLTNLSDEGEDDAGKGSPSGTVTPEDPSAGTSVFRRKDSISGLSRTPGKRTRETSRHLTTPVRSDKSKFQHPYGLQTPPATAHQSRSFTQPDSQQQQQHLLTLSKKLSRREPLAAKPKPVGQPLVWAESRQALCETLPYFKVPQSGCHQNDGHVYAFLLDGVGGTREYMDTDVIIARAGGGMETADDKVGMVARKHHEMKHAQVKSVFNGIAHQNPLIVISGNKNQGAICAMPHRYCVLGWYKPIAVWAEKTAGNRGAIFTTIKYRFERLRDEETAWYAPSDTILTEEERATIGEPIKKTCSHCKREFFQAYLAAWMCLNPECCAFWKLNGEQDAAYDELDYHPAFLLHRTKWRFELEPFSVRPGVPDVGNAIGDNITKINTKGLCCPRCGRCSHRRLWKGWQCDNTDCTFEFTPSHRPVKPAMLHNPWDVIGEGPSLSQNKCTQEVRIKVDYIEGYKVNRYTFEGIDGCLVHAISNKTINDEPRGPDAMFQALQSSEGDAVPLERQRFHRQRSSSSKTEDEDLMMAFSINYGMPYRYVASGASRPFEDSPWPIRTCRSTLNQASKVFLGPDNHKDFNEQLVIAYMEGQKMEYHDDGEEGLGTRIASLSLGGKAKMHLRMKRRHYVGCSKNGIFNKEQPKPGGIGGPDMDQKRLQAWEQWQQAKKERSYEKRQEQISDELGLLKNKDKLAPDMVVITLHHGDIVFMEGYEIQQYLEHKVVSENNLRFAMTCRTVLEGHLKAGDEPDYEVLPGNEADSFLRI